MPDYQNKAPLMPFIFMMNKDLRSTSLCSNDRPLMIDQSYCSLSQLISNALIKSTVVDSYQFGILKSYQYR